jgi:hypothetical protein
MMCVRHSERLDTWIGAVEADDLPELHRFTAGLCRDHNAVAAGLSMRAQLRRRRRHRQ